MDVGSDTSTLKPDAIELTVCVWGPRENTVDQTKPHFLIYASLGKLPAQVESLEHLDAVDIMPTGKRLYDIRNERFVLLKVRFTIFWWFFFDNYLSVCL